MHTAPAHGADDFYTGARYGLDQTATWTTKGGSRNGRPEWEGFTVFEANEPIIELLEARGALMGRSDIYHSYPHCWRCHNPVIFRATEQWFIGMETPMKNDDGYSENRTFRQRALDEIKRVKWDPAWGEERIWNMIATRPDWCISRQRIWGVPIAVFLCNKCHTPLEDQVVNKQHRCAVRERRRGGVAQVYVRRTAAGGTTVCAVRAMATALSARRWTSSTCGSIRGQLECRAGGNPMNWPSPRISTSKGEISIAGGSTLPCSARSR